MNVGVIGFGCLDQIGARAAIVVGAEAYVAGFKEDVWDSDCKAGAVSLVKSVVAISNVISQQRSPRRCRVSR